MALPPIIAVLGGIASGKSTVVSYLKEVGACGIHADEINKEVLNRPEIREQIRARWQVTPYGQKLIKGAEGISRCPGSYWIFNGAGDLQYNEIALLVFQHPKELSFLQDITKPFVVKRMLELLDIYYNPYQKLIVIDAPMLLELQDCLSSFFTLRSLDFPKIYFVDCPQEMRIARYAARTHRNIVEAGADLILREKNQISLENKKALSVLSIDNSGDQYSLVNQVRKLWTEITKETL